VPKILIGTPAYDQQVTVAYPNTVMSLMAQAGRTPGLQFELSAREFTVISWARNYYATRVLQDPSYTHLLFVDADMGFRPSLVEKMLSSGKDICACLYPTRRNDYPELKRTAASARDVASWRQRAARYAGRALKKQDGELVIEGHFARTVAAGTGVMLIKREALERLREAYPRLWSDDPNGHYRKLGLKSGVFQVFEAVQSPDGIFSSEDMSFCIRWTAIGGEIWTCIDEPIQHVGREVFIGDYSKVLGGHAPG